MTNWVNVDDLVVFLREHPGLIYVLETKRGALVYWRPMDAVIYLEGDFRGNEEENLVETQRLLSLITPDSRW
jgi:hypothetical protein